MDRPFNPTGKYCYRSGLVCDHNQIDGPMRSFICTGIGGECTNGSAFEYYVKKTDSFLELLPDSHPILDLGLFDE